MCEEVFSTNDILRSVLHEGLVLLLDGVVRVQVGIRERVLSLDTTLEELKDLARSNCHAIIEYIPRNVHDDAIKWKHFPRYWPFVRGIHRSPVIPLTKANEVELWCLLWSSPEQTVERTIETPEIETPSRATCCVSLSLCTGKFHSYLSG